MDSSAAASEDTKPDVGASSSSTSPVLYTIICEVLWRVFQDGKSHLPDFPSDFVQQLLKESDTYAHAQQEEQSEAEPKKQEIILEYDSIDMEKGVLARPYLCCLAKAVYLHATRLEPLLRYAPVENLQDRTVSPSIILDVDKQILLDIERLETPGVDGDRTLARYLNKIQPGGVLLLLGMQRTRKSLDILPPGRLKLAETFQARNSSKEILSVGARALSKHNHRSSEGFWGVAKGSQASQNLHAEKILTNILDNAVWMNIHLLPGDVGVYEIRIKDGYGARWSADGSMFRGFLEPQIEQGWAVGWKH